MSLHYLVKNISVLKATVENIGQWRRRLECVVQQQGGDIEHIYRAKLRVARYCHGKLSVRPSVTLRYRDHIGWNSAKIISRLISLTISLSADPHMTDLLQREHLQILAGIAVR